MDETKKAWNEVGEGFAKLGRMLSDRYQQTPKPTEATEGAVKDSVKRATDELDRALTALGETLRDDEARAHMKETGKKLGDALKATFNDVSEQIRKSVGNPPPDQGGST